MNLLGINIFSDSSYIGQVGITVIPYKSRIEETCVRLYIGIEDKHTVFEAELAGVAICTKLLNQVIGRNHKIGLDNRVAIWTSGKRKQYQDNTLCTSS